MIRSLRLLGLLVIAMLSSGATPTATVAADAHPCIDWFWGGRDCIVCETNVPDCVVLLCNRLDGGGIEGRILC